MSSQKLSKLAVKKSTGLGTSGTGPTPDDSQQDWEKHFVLRLPEADAEKLNDLVSRSDPPVDLREKLKVQFQPDMRHGKVYLIHHTLNGTMMDLPCIVECQKTLDGKNFYKVADIAQIMVCKPEEESPSDAAKKDGDAKESSRKEDKKFQHNHGLAPPLKNVRKRRFRKTLRKKYMDAPDIEKELKRLLRADLDAENVRWEIVADGASSHCPPAASSANSQSPVIFSESNSPTKNLSLQPKDSDTNILQEELFGSELSTSSGSEEDDGVSRQSAGVDKDSLLMAEETDDNSQL